MLSIILCLLALGITIILAIAAYRDIPFNMYGLELFMNKPTGRKQRNGWTFTWPIVGEFRLYDSQLRTTHFELDVSTGDDKPTELTIKGSVKWRPSFSRLETWARLEESGERATVDVGIIDGLKSRLRSIVGMNKGDSFIGESVALAELVNAVMKVDPRQLPSGGLVSLAAWKAWHTAHQSLDVETESDVEVRYGIEIEEVDIVDVDEPQAVKTARTGVKVAQAQLEASQVRSAERIRLTKELLAAGVPAEQVDAAVAEQLGFTDGKRQVISVTGSGGAVPLLNIQPTKRGG